jgi:hypothetical protein
MKKQAILPIAFLLFVVTSQAQQPGDSYDFSYPKIKFAPLQPATGLTFKTSHVAKTSLLSAENLDALSPLIDIDLKFNRKTPDVNFYYNVSGMESVASKTITDEGKYFKEITYSIKNSIDCIGKDGTTFNSILMENDSKVKTIRVGSNFFRQLTSDNDKYPKPREISNIDGSPGYVPSFEESFRKPVPAGFATQAELDAFMNKYNNFIMAKAEALAVEKEFDSDVAMLELLFGTKTFREDFAVAMVKQKSRPFNYDDFDKAGELLKSAYKIFSVNITDTAAYYPMLRNVVKTYADIAAANEERVRFEIIQSIIHHNISLANAFLLNIEQAALYAEKFSGNKRSAPMPAQILYKTIDFMKKRAVSANTPANVLEKVPKS